MSTITLQHLLDACSPGGASVLTSVTPLEPAAGPHASVAPAKFVSGSKSVFAYERRFWNGEAVTAVLVDSKQSQNNRLEATVSAAIADEDPVLTRTPRIELRFEDGQVYSDLDLPHRAFDGQIRAGTINGETVTSVEEYRKLRDATVSHARPLLERSPMTLLLGGWDASRKSHQGRYRSILVGEIIGILADQDGGAEANQSKRGGARIDPVGMRIDLGDKERKAIAEAQKHELSASTYKSASGKNGKASTLGLGGVSRRRWSNSVGLPVRRSSVPMCSVSPRFVPCASTLRRRKVTSPVERCWPHSLSTAWHVPTPSSSYGPTATWWRPAPQSSHWTSDTGRRRASSR